MLISNNTILDQVIEEPAIASYYFLTHNLDENWFYENVTTSLNALGTRYNSEFNVTTTLNQYLDLFSCNENAIRLYSNAGFVKVGERKNYYSEPVENAILMTKYF